MQFDATTRARLKSRLLDQVVVNGTCWLWAGKLYPNGYGYIVHNSTPLAVHRLSYTLLVGAIPPRLSVLHTCEGQYPLGDRTSRRCINPAHLHVGTSRDNYRDMVTAGRVPHIDHSWSQGESSQQAKLTEADVVAIRDRYAEGASQRSLARQYAIDKALVGRIVHRQSWAHVRGGAIAPPRDGRGEGNSQAVLTADDVRAIRAEYAAGHTTYAAIAARYNVHLNLVWQIVKRQLWTHVE